MIYFIMKSITITPSVDIKGGFEPSDRTRVPGHIRKMAVECGLYLAGLTVGDRECPAFTPEVTWVKNVFREMIDVQEAGRDNEGLNPERREEHLKTAEYLKWFVTDAPLEKLSEAMEKHRRVKRAIKLLGFKVMKRICNKRERPVNLLEPVIHLNFSELK